MKRIALACIAVIGIVSCTKEKDKYDLAIENFENELTVFSNAIASEDLDSVSLAFDRVSELSNDTILADTMNMSKVQKEKLEATFKYGQEIFNSYAKFIENNRGEILMTLKTLQKSGEVIMKLTEIGLDYDWSDNGSIITQPFTYRGINIEAAVFYAQEGVVMSIGLYASEESNSISTLENIVNVIDKKDHAFTFLGVETGLNEVWIMPNATSEYADRIEYLNKTMDLSKANGSFSKYTELQLNHYHVTKAEAEASERAAEEAIRALGL